MDDARHPSRHPGLATGLARIASLLLLTSLLGGCASSTAPRTGDPLTDVRNPDLKVSERIEAAKLAWAEADRGVGDREEVRKTLKDVAWPSETTPVSLRLAVIDQLFADPEGEADSRNFARLTLPYEPKIPVVEHLAFEAAGRGWVEVTPSLIQSYARPSPDIPEEERPERAALEALHPGKSAAEVAFEVFLHPEVEDGPYAEDDRRALREDAWDLLARLDADGSMRASLLGAAEPGSPVRGEEPIETSLAACVRDLRLLPRTGHELSWLQRLRASGSADWWSQAAGAMALAEGEAGVRLRHVEPMRWASIHRREWAEASRLWLLSELESRLEGRPFNRRARGREGEPLRYERLSEWGPSLGRMDLLAILVIDEALRDEGLRRELFRQADLDQEDTTTEYGGILDPIMDPIMDPATDPVTDPVESGRYRALLYPPRPMARLGDKKFVASRDMIEQSDRSLAHYHFHVQTWNNARFAGPSPDDQLYATNHARSCLVFTAVGSDELAVDYYQPGGVVIDLGEIPRPPG